MQTSDHSNFFQFISDFPNQIQEAPSLIKDLNIKTLKKEYQQVVLTGMGGSAIAGDLLKSYLQDEFNIPFIVNRNYTLPNFVGPQTLVISCSYSGNTEETLTATQTAMAKKALVIGLTTGGKLEKVLIKAKLPLIKIPDGYPPRQALGYIFFPILHLFQHLGLTQPQNDAIRETIKVLQELRERKAPPTSRNHNLAKLIAQKLYRKVPVIYTASELLYPVVTRWRNQFNENSKVLAFSNVLPELNHNEIMGWEAPREVLEKFNILFLRDQSELSRNKIRLEITKDIFQKNNVPIFEVFGEGKSLLARIFSLLYIGDWVSYYLALLYEKDPLKIDSIQFLKDSLSKLKK
jgi:glucose/mannose-6-phosphate isomerase